MDLFYTYITFMYLYAIGIIIANYHSDKENNYLYDTSISFRILYYLFIIIYLLFAPIAIPVTYGYNYYFTNSDEEL